MTLSLSGTDLLKLIIFGSTGTTWEESRQEILGFLALAPAEWDPEII